MAKISNEIILKNIIIEAAKDRKAKEITILDLRKLDQSIADYFIICHGNSTTQVNAIADHIDKQARAEVHEHYLSKDGSDNSQWILLDYGAIVIHVFQEEHRRFYNLEELWADAVKEEIEEE